MTTHTPGPWKLIEPAEGDDYTKPRPVFEAREPEGESMHKFRVADAYAWGSCSERDANAHLIAAAPDLLGFASMVLSLLETPGPAHVRWDKIESDARRLIAQAKGGGA